MSDQVIAEIERSVDDFSKRLKAQVMVIYANDRLWLVSAHMLGLRVQGPDLMTALRDFDALVRQRTDYSVKLAQTLGLEAAE